jgi:hypothetical protein
MRPDGPVSHGNLHNGPVRNVLTPSDCLVFSRLDWPDEQLALPEVFDAFARVVDSVSTGKGSVGGVQDGQLLVAHVSAPEFMFRAVPVLSDGCVWPRMVPPSWQGHITRPRLAAYFRSEWLM